MKNILGIDTSQQTTVIGINGRVVAWESVRNQSKELLPRIDKLLKGQKIKPEALKGVVVNIGPGSFTGLRVGVTIANGFGYGLKIPVAGVSEFDVIKAMYNKADWIVLNARRDELFVQYKKTKPILMSKENIALFSSLLIFAILCIALSFSTTMPFEQNTNNNPDYESYQEKGTMTGLTGILSDVPEIIGLIREWLREG